MAAQKSSRSERLRFRRCACGGGHWSLAWFARLGPCCCGRRRADAGLGVRCSPSRSDSASFCARIGRGDIVRVVGRTVSGMNKDEPGQRLAPAYTLTEMLVVLVII